MKRFALKRITAFVLALVMTLSLLPMNVWAVELQEDTDEQVVMATEEAEKTSIEATEEPSTEDSEPAEEPVEEPSEESAPVEEEEALPADTTDDESSETEYVSESAVVSAPLANSAASAYEARWGLATGTNRDKKPTNWTNGTLTEAMTYANGLTSGTAYIQLLSDVDTTAQLAFAKDTTTILDLNGKTIDRGLTAATENGYVIKVSGNLTLCDSSTPDVTKQGKITGSSSHGVYVNGTFTMEGGSISGNSGDRAYDGGGVYVYGGTFRMKGGSISGNKVYDYGGGVYVGYGSSFTMTGGTISGNTAADYGGGVCVNGGTFTMEGGSISDNTADYDGGGVYVKGGTFTMNGGTISGNTAIKSGGGVCVYNDSAFTMNGGTISGNTAIKSGGGVRVYYFGTFTMKGGTISENTASTNGGGVYVDDGFFTMSDGTISENTAINSGGGVYVSGGIFTMNGGTISENTASTYHGGGVCVNDGGEYVYSDSTFTMNGGTISENTAINSGGGVYVDYGETFTMNGGTISENTASTNGGGVYVKGGGVYDKGGTFTMNGGTISGNRASYGGGVYVDETMEVSGAPVISGNVESGAQTASNVYLPGGIKIVVDTLSAGANIGITMEDGKGTFTNGGASYANSGFFTADTGAVAVMADGNNLRLALIFTISFDANGGSGTMDAQRVIEGFYATLKNTFTRTNYTFTGWNTKADGTGTAYADRSSFRITRDMTLYAQWEVAPVRWGLATGENKDQAPTAWTIGTLDKAMTYANSLTSGTAYIQLLMDAYPAKALTFDKAAVLDLNGYDIDRGLTELMGDGYVLNVNGSLTLCDSSTTDATKQGKITGGYANYGGGVYVSRNSTFTMTGGTISGNTAKYGGGVYVSSGSTFTMNGGTISGNTADSGGGVEVNGGTFTMNGGTITGNTALYGGGVYVSRNSTFTMTGGTISGNTAKDGGGVYVYGTMKVSGTPVISGNVKSGTQTANNVYLPSGKTITVNKLSTGTNIGITMEDGKGTFTIGGAAYADNGFFTADTGAATVMADGNNLRLALIVTISFDANGGSGTMDVQPVEAGVAATLNKSVFTRSGYTFTGWNTKADGTGTAYADGASITATTDTTLYAQWYAPEARWGQATGEKNDQAPTSWTVGMLSEAMAYANNLTSGTAYIQLLMDVDTTAPLVFNSGKTTILDLNSFDVDRGLTVETTNGYVLRVVGNLTLCDTSANAVTAPGKITGGYDDGTSGGVYVYSGTFTMSGGTISGNDGSGVYVKSGTFTMNGGTISGNTAKYHSGGVYVDDGTFTMTGGTISGNTASTYGGGVFVDGGSTFTMNGGTITGNTASYSGGGVYVNGTFTMNGGTISGNTAHNSGGGVYVSGGFYMYGGTISGNTANSGGGVYVSGSFTMNGGTISENTASHGGGVYVSGGFYMYGGTISGNTANGDGGGVYVDYGETFTMNGGTISGNTATERGGGVYVRGIRYASDGGIFTMNGGTISGNTAAERGGGVYVNRPREWENHYVTMKVSGAPVISGNVESGAQTASNVYLPGGIKIVVDTLSAGANIGITMEDGKGTFTNGGASYADSGFFTDDTGAATVMADGNNLRLALIVTISFDANGGSGTMDVQPVEAGVAATLKKNTFTRSEYVFVGWNTKADGTGTAYADGASITITRDTTLYAQWEVTQVRWGLATGENKDQAPTSWTIGTLDKAMTYANNLTSGTAYIQLLMDVDTTASLEFARGKTTILDLNGFDVDRGLTVETTNGSVIAVKGNLTLCDTSTTDVTKQGRITGGYSNDYGGGVYVYNSGTFTMNGGTISGNTADDGGGVCVNSGTFTMNGGTISGNTASYSGGGVYVYNSGTFTINGGTISGNTASYSGGGVRVYSVSTFTMNGGTITGNTADDGGGVYVYNSGTFTMNGGTISGNTASYSGGGVRVDGTMKVSGAPVISGNVKSGWQTANNVYLPSGKEKITVDTLSIGANIGITRPTGEGTFTTGGASYTDSGYFISDVAAYVVTAAGEDLRLVVRITGTVSIVGTAEYGQILVANYTGSETVTYQWYRGDVAIDGATQSTYSLGLEDIGSVIKVMVTGNGDYGGKVTATQSNAVDKATPSVSVPTGLTAVCGELLGDIPLPVAHGGSWSWKDSTVSVGGEGENTFILVFIPMDPGYNTVEVPVTVTVKNVPNGLWCTEIPDQMYTGKAIQPKLEVYYRDTLLTLNKDYSISYKNNTNAATFDAKDAKGKDIAPQIIIKGKGNFAGTLTKTFTILPINLDDPQISALDMAALYNGKVQNPKVTVSYDTKKLGNKDFVVSYPDTDTTNGTPYLDAGIWTIQVDGTGNYTGTRYVNFTITAGALMSKATIGKFATYEYTGEAIEPVVTVTMSKVTLVEDTDYTVEYLNNTEVGTATVVVTGMGNYAGTKTATFKITGLAISKAVVTGLPKDMDYTGEAITLSDYVLTDKASGEELVEGVDYTVSYEKNTAKGTATILFTGINKYSGTLKKTFKINGYDILKNTAGLFAVEEDIVAPFMKSGAKPVPVVTFNGKVLTAGTDYTLAYKNNTTIPAEGAPVSKLPTITISGKGNFSGKVTVNFAIQPKPLAEVELLVDDKPFTEKATGLPTVSLVDADGKKLAAGKDYDKVVSYTYTSDVELNDGTMRNAGDTVDKKDSIRVGTVLRVTVEGMGAYTGEATTTYRIVPASLAKATVKVTNQQYTGKPIIPDKKDITVTLNKVELDADDYEIVSCTNNVNKGSAMLVIRGVGENYGGIKTVKFKIDAKAMFWYR